ncbi:hypothetical protein MKW98_007305, partial [Papaver atlanticum]
CFITKDGAYYNKLLAFTLNLLTSHNSLSQVFFLHRFFFTPSSTSILCSYSISLYRFPPPPPLL